MKPKIIHLKPKQRSEKNAMTEAELEHRRCQHKFLFQQIAVSVLMGASYEDVMSFDSHVLDACEKIAKMILDKTEEIGKQ